MSGNTEGREADRFGVTGDVLDRAVEAAAAEPRPDSNGWTTSPLGVRDAEIAVKAALPVIAEAGYRAGIEEARAAVLREKADCEQKADEGRDVNSPWNPEACEQRAWACEDILLSLSALTDTEGRE